jgi:hypothetical protein
MGFKNAIEVLNLELEAIERFKNFNAAAWTYEHMDKVTELKQAIKLLEKEGEKLG